MTDAITTEGFDTGRARVSNLAVPSPRRLSPGSDYRSGAGRPAGIAFVALFHLGLLYAVLVYTGIRPMPILHAPIEVRTIELAKPPEAPPPPPPPDTFKAPPPPFIPLPEISIAAAPKVAPVVAVTTSVVAPVPAPTAAPAPAPEPAKRVLPDIDMRHSSDPLYPPESRRRAEEGLVVLLVLVETDGQPSDIRLEQSSGHDRLDQAAIDGAKHNLRYVPGTVDGKPERMWMRYRYKFQLR